MADKENPDPQVIPYLLYADAGAAMDWLVKTFGFTVRARDARQDGTVTDLKSHRDRTKAALAEASEMQNGPQGWRSYSVNDPEGHQWYFTEPDG